MPALYRGFRDQISPGTNKNPFWKLDRKPKDLPLWIHDRANNWFEAKFGVRARSQSMMCSTDIHQARSYSSHVYRVIPLKPYLLIHSEGVRDFLSIVVREERGDRGPASVEEWLEDKRFKAVEDVDQIATDFLGEVMLYCEEFISVVI